MGDCGVVYVASKRGRYVEEAFLSAESIKQRYPDLPITLFTDQPGHRLCSSGVFDEVEPLSGVTGFVSQWSEGQLNRLISLSRTPYRRTLHLDTDTRVFTDDLLSLFGLLDEVDVAMVETTVHDSYSRVHYGRPMFNAGFVLYRCNEKTSAWLLEWAALSKRNFGMASQTPLPRLPILEHIDDDNVRRKLLCMDQISLVEILSPEVNRFALHIKILDYSWNYRGFDISGKDATALKIWHYPRQSAQTHDSDVDEAIMRIGGGKIEAKRG